MFHGFMALKYNNYYINVIDKYKINKKVACEKTDKLFHRISAILNELKLSYLVLSSQSTSRLNVVKLFTAVIYKYL